MTTINLYQSEVKEKSKSPFALDGTMMASIGLAAIVFICYVGIIAYTSILKNSEEKIISKIEEQKKIGLAGESVNKAADFQARLDYIVKGQSKEDMNSILDNVGSLLVSGTSLGSYGYDGQNISLTFKADTFSAIARQLANLKKSTDFSGAQISNIRRSEKNIMFDVKMTLVKSSKN